MKKSFRGVALAAILALTVSMVPAMAFGAAVPERVSIEVIQHKAKGIKVTWDKVEGADGYQVYRGKSKKGDYSLRLTTQKTRYVHNGVKVGTRYYYKVRAYKVVNGKKKYGRFSQVKTIKVRYTIPKITATMPTKLNNQKLTFTVSNHEDAKTLYLVAPAASAGICFMTFPNGLNVDELDQVFLFTKYSIKNASTGKTMPVTTVTYNGEKIKAIAIKAGQKIKVTGKYMKVEGDKKLTYSRSKDVLAFFVKYNSKAYAAAAAYNGKKTCVEVEKL